MNSFILHIIALFSMLLDHSYHTVAYNYSFLNCIGRLAFPIFAFMIVEGFFNTSNRKKYIKRMFIFALISEIPFNLMLSKSIINFSYQNVLWTFLIALILMYLNEKFDKKDNPAKTSFIMFATMILGGIFGILLSTDYAAAGVLTVLTFYYFKEKSWFNRVIQLLMMALINLKMLGGWGWTLNILGASVFVPVQGLAILSLIPIWLYNGKHGPYNKIIKNIYWWFYPVHMILLVSISFLIK